MSSEHITYMGRSKCFLTYSCLALAMRDVFANFVALLTCNAVAKRCVFNDLYTCFIFNTMYNCLKLAGSSHILTKLIDAQRRTALFFVTQGVGCASCMCDWVLNMIRHRLIRTFYMIQYKYNSFYWGFQKKHVNMQDMPVRCPVEQIVLSTLLYTILYTF